VLNGMSLSHNKGGVLCLKSFSFVKNKPSLFLSFESYLYCLLMVLRKLFETDRHFILKSGFDVRDSDVRDAVSSPVKYIWKPKRASFTSTICRVT